MAETESSRITKLTSWWKLTEDNSFLKNYRARDEENRLFYLGGSGQWDKESLKLLKAEGRPALTINGILPAVDLISGFERQNRQDIKVYPRKGGNHQIALILTELAKHTMDTSNGNYEQSAVFTDGIIGSKGWMSMDISYENDPRNGDIVIKKEQAKHIREDPYSKEYDLNLSARFIVKDYWWDEETIKLNYPKANLKGDLGVESESGEIVPDDTDSYQEENMHAAMNARYNDQSNRNKYRIKEWYWKSYERRTFLINVVNLDFVQIDKTKIDLIKKIMAKFKKGTFVEQERIVPVLHKTVTVGELELENIDDPFNGISLYPLFRFCPYWLDGVAMGKIDNLKDPQREKNKRRSQALHYLNSISDGWVYEQGSITNPDDLDIPHANIEYKAGKQAPGRKPMPQLSVGHLALSEKGADDIKEISGANNSLQGMVEDRGESGKTVEKRQMGGALIQEPVMDNWHYTQQIFATALIEVIRRSNVYSKEEIKAIVDESTIKPEDKVDMDKLRDFKTGRYGIKISNSPSMPTARAANFASMLQAVEMGMPLMQIAPDLVVEASDWPSKKEIADRFKKLQKQQQGQPQ